MSSQEKATAVETVAYKVDANGVEYTLEQRKEESIRFLKALYEKVSEGLLCLNPRPSGRPQWFKASQLESAARTAFNLAESDDVYVGIGVRSSMPESDSETGESRKTGDATLVSIIPGIWAEVDWAQDGAHASNHELPPTPNDARALIEHMPLKPTILVESGHGYHAYWLFDEPWHLRNDQDRHEAQSLLRGWESLLRSKAKARNWKIDCTASLAQTMRLPGTFNRKNDLRKLVRIVSMDLSAMGLFPRELVQKCVQANATHTEKGGEKSRSSDRPADLDAILEGCAWLRHCRDDAETLSEPEWHAMLSIVGRCEGGEAKAHEWSMPHPGYSKATCATKLKGALSEKSGPRTCTNISEQCGGETFCKSCPNNGKIKSPIVLGLDKTSMFVRRYIWVVELERFFDLETMTYLNKSQVSDRHAHEIRGLAARLISSSLLRKVDKPTYQPGADRFVREYDGTVIKECVNVWHDSGATAEPGDVAPFLEHMRNLVPHDAERKHILDWLAFLVQRPNDKIKHSVLIQGGQGIGKSFIGDVLERVLGKSNSRAVEPEEMIGDWGGWLTNTQLVVVHEMRSGDAVGAYDKLKSLITQKSVRINEKGIPIHEMPNKANFLMFTNHEDAVRLEKDDRRFFIYFSPMQKQASEYYKRLFGWLADGGAGALRHYLAKRPLDDFEHEASPPETEHKRLMMEESRTEVERTLQSLWEQEIFPLKQDLVSVMEIVRCTDSRPPATHRSVSKWLRSIGALPLGQIRIEGNGRIVLWATRRQWYYKELLQKGEAMIAAKYLEQHAFSANQDVQTSAF